MTLIKQKGELPKAYEPQEVEDRIYQFWLAKGYFTPKIDNNKRPFVIIMPPPNVTGELHLGHALTATLEDIMTRWHRMKGESTLWLPGADHAGIATQVVVEQQLAAEGLTRYDLGRERFVERAWQWASSCRENIIAQHKKLGASCDWTRDRFTLDEKPSHAVATTFVHLFNKELVYRGERIINWCPRCQTALSDLEVEHREVTGHLYYINYPIVGESRYVTVATTRPETMFGDTAVAVNPEDKRFTNLIGKRVAIPVIGRPIPVITDEAVDPSFGTGALKITPAHDPVDFEVAQRHNLPLVNILNLNATLNEEAGPYRGFDRFDCRRALLLQLEKEGLLLKTEPYLHSIGHCARCNTVVEPRASKQWFINTEPLTKPAIKAVKEGRITIIPEHFTKVYLYWMENIRDWCISRQLWWGHRIPVWYCGDCDGEHISIAVRGQPEDWGKPPFSDLPEVKAPGVVHRPPLWIDTYSGHRKKGYSHDYIMKKAEAIGIDLSAKPIVSAEVPRKCLNCGSDNLVPDPDVLDTWFSSALWPHSTLGWPDDTEDLRYFYPTTVMETGYDILFFWVARMIMMGLENTGDIPFRWVYLHGLIRDEQGEKMSKIRGNVINPVEAIEEYGADALRFAITTGSAPGNDVQVSSEKLEAGRNFANKLWNAARFVIRSLPPGLQDIAPPPVLPVEDRWILSRLDQLIAKVNHLLEDFQFGEAEREIYDFLWHEFCDWYIELAKIRLHRHSDKSEPSPLPALVQTLETSLRLLHPFMPFITEEIWQRLVSHLPRDEARPDSLMVAAYPTAKGATDTQAEEEMESVIEIIHSIRNARAQSRIEPARWIEAQIYTKNKSTIKSHRRSIETLARVQPLAILDPGKERGDKEGALVLVLRDAKVVLPMAVDLDAERQRLEKEKEALQAKIDRLETRLRDGSFLSKAPPLIIERERGKLLDSQGKLEKIEERLTQLY